MIAPCPPASSTPDPGRPPTRVATDDWGIDTRWTDAHGVEQAVAPETLEVLRGLIGHPPDERDSRAPVVTRPGQALPGGLAGEVECEDGSSRRVEGTLPRDFPLGYHVLHADGRAGTTAHSVAGPLLAARALARLGARGPALRRPVSRQLGDR